MHLIFARQHNRIARTLSNLNPHWKDEKLFQESRKIVGAQMQHITYSEFLPSILPKPLLQLLNLTTDSTGYFRGYDSTVNPSIANGFAAAAFRFGHSLLPVSNSLYFLLLVQYRLRSNLNMEDFAGTDGQGKGQMHGTK